MTGSTEALAAASRCAMVFAHPAHELAALGLIQRLRPQLLFLTRADSAGDEDRENLAQQALRRFDLASSTTFFGIAEAEVYRWLIEGDLDAVLALRARLLDWLDRTRPDAVFGDAFELTNVVHDLGRAVLDSALREWMRTNACRSFELPLASRTAAEMWKFHFQEFPGDTAEVFLLAADERRAKKETVDWMGGKLREAAIGAQVFPLEREVFREVPPDRDYTVPPSGLKLHYDDWGRIQVARGKYKEAIMFATHFAPLARQLP
jgi:hypothetical protein